MVHSIASKTLGQNPPPPRRDGWGGPAPFAVWADPAWSPHGGWVNKFLYTYYNPPELTLFAHHHGPNAWHAFSDSFVRRARAYYRRLTSACSPMESEFSCEPSSQPVQMRSIHLLYRHFSCAPIFGGNRQDCSVHFLFSIVIVWHRLARPSAALLL